MIIGSIVDVSQTASGVGTNATNGVGLIHFYTMEDAVQWARLQSDRLHFNVSGSSSYLFTATVVINTDTNERRWWFDGTEYTG